MQTVDEACRHCVQKQNEHCVLALFSDLIEQTERVCSCMLDPKRHDTCFIGSKMKCSVAKVHINEKNSRKINKQIQMKQKSTMNEWKMKREQI